MKLIGDIKPEFEGDERRIVNGDYLGGSIVMLTKKETKLLGMLQDAWDGNTLHFPEGYPLSDPYEAELSTPFKAIYSFVEAKLAINEFRETVEKLDTMLVKTDEP